MRSANALLLLVGLVVATGCTQGPVQEGSSQEETAATLDAIQIQNGIFINGMTVNGMTVNGIFINGMTVNGMTVNGMTVNGLNAGTLSALQDPDASGEAARTFFRYTVACAFLPSQTFDFTWTDAADATHVEHYPGELGLAPEWATGPLDGYGQRMVSACLGAHVNYYGALVTVSARSSEPPLRLHPHDDELDEFPNVEGAFWGNIFGSNPYINACYKSSNVDNSRAQQRDCAAGHLLPDGTIEECGIVNIVGSCNNVCKKFKSSRGHYEDCRERPGVSHKRTDLVITTALP